MLRNVYPVSRPLTLAILVPAVLMGFATRSASVFAFTLSDPNTWPLIPAPAAAPLAWLLGRSHCRSSMPATAAMEPPSSPGSTIHSEEQRGGHDVGVANHPHQLLLNKVQPGRVNP
jgi:hypothetical protein